MGFVLIEVPLSPAAAPQVVIDLPEHMRGAARRSYAAAPAWRTALAPGACDPPGLTPDKCLDTPASNPPQQGNPVVQGSALQAAPPHAGVEAECPDPSSEEGAVQLAADADAGKCAMHARTALKDAHELPQAASACSTAAGRGAAAQCPGFEQGLSQAHLDAVCGFDVGGWRLLDLALGASKPCKAWRTSGSAPGAAHLQLHRMPQGGTKGLNLNLAHLGSPGRPRPPEAPRPVHHGVPARGPISSPAAGAQPAQHAAKAHSATAAPGVAKEQPTAGSSAPRQPASASELVLDGRLRTGRAHKRGSPMKGRAALAAKPAQTGLGSVGLVPGNPKLAALSSLGQSLLGLNADAALVAAFLRARGAAELHGELHGQSLPCS